VNVAQDDPCCCSWVGRYWRPVYPGSNLAAAGYVVVGRGNLPVPLRQLARREFTRIAFAWFKGVPASGSPLRHGATRGCFVS